MLQRADSTSGVFATLFVVVLMVAALAGWFMNFGQLIGMSFEPLTGMAVARVIGVFIAPLGSILGYI